MTQNVKFPNGRLLWRLKSILSFWYHRYIHMKYEVKLQLEGTAYKLKPRSTTSVT